MKKEKKEKKVKQSKEKKQNGKFKDGFIIFIMLAATVALSVIGISAYADGSDKTDESTTVATTWNEEQEVIQSTEAAPQTTEATAAETTTKTEKATEKETTKKAEEKVTEKEKEETTKAPETTEKQEKDETEEILAAISDGINSLKASDANFTGIKTQDISVQLTTCSVPALTGLINKVIEIFTGEETFTYEFVNGVAEDPEGSDPISSSKAIPPTDKPFTLTKEGVASAKKEKDGDNTVYTIVVVAEKSTLADPRPPHHNAAGDTFDLSELDIPTGEITKADFEYPGATVSVTVDKDGKVIRYHEHLDMKGVGEGNAIGINASGEMEGYIDETWDIQWK